MRRRGGQLLRDDPPSNPQQSQRQNFRAWNGFDSVIQTHDERMLWEKSLESTPKTVREGKSWPKQSRTTSDPSQQGTPPSGSPPSPRLTFAPCRWLEIQLIRVEKGTHHPTPPHPPHPPPPPSPHLLRCMIRM